MTPGNRASTRFLRPGKFLVAAIARLGSLKLAVVLLAALAVVIAIATVLETRYGRPHALWYIYQSAWFVGLLGLLGVNILCAALSRLPWKRQHTGFVVTHAGLLVLLAGSILTFTRGIEGQVTLVEGMSTARMMLPQQSQVTASWVNQPREAPYEYAFEPGPSNWREGTTLDLGSVDGVGVRVLRYYRHAQAVEEWSPDETGIGGPSVRVKITGPHDESANEHLLVDQDLGDEVPHGTVRIRLQRALSDRMLADFLHPPPVGEGGPQGLLVAYHEGRAIRVPVTGSVGKRVALDDRGTALEIVAYHPNARPDAQVRFRSLNQEPQNPLLELSVHLPGHKQPLRQLAFARNPLVSLDPVYGQDCPVRFYYYHPGVELPPTAEFMQASDGKLYARVLHGKKIGAGAPVATGDSLVIPGNLALSVVEHQPHVRPRLTFEPVEVTPGQKTKPEAAAEIEITVAGTTQVLWVQRNHSVYGNQIIATPEGHLRVKFGAAEAPLGFSLRLMSFRRGMNPGGVGNATYASVVQVLDGDRGIEQEREISMNHPLTYNRLTFYQSGFDEAGHGISSSTLSVAHDPGRGLKYAGSLMICLGIAIMFYMRAYFFRHVPLAGQAREVIAEMPPDLTTTATPTEEPVPCASGATI